jgi:hypothetical protein
MMRRSAGLLFCLVLAACSGTPRPRPAATPAAPRPTPAPEVVAAPPPISANQSVWTRTAGLRLRGESSMTTMPYLFMRLEVLRADTTELLVRCVHCPGAPTGWIARESVVHYAPMPLQATRMELADFALAVRNAASRRDLNALRQVMTRHFAGSLEPVEAGNGEILARWEREGFRDLDRMPFLMDRGIVPVGSTPVWAAPPQYAATPGYGDLRTGFRRGANGWEWLFLVANGR